jgi:hypothetical protein
MRGGVGVMGVKSADGFVLGSSFWYFLGMRECSARGVVCCEAC